MTDSKTSRHFEAERRKTDESLVVERDKTNQSVSKARARTEKRTDQIVDAERLKADEITSASRTANDVVGSRTPKNSNDVSEERRQTDLAKQQSRDRIDAAMDRERDHKDALLSELLGEERKETDRNLSEERQRTDSGVVKYTGLLDAEVAAHLKTKTTLLSRNEFLAIVSHDLRNPIGAISSCASLLLDESCFKNLEPEVRDWIAVIKRNADSSLRLIGDLLDVERIGQGKLQIQFGSCDANDIIHDALKMFEQASAAKNISLRTDLTGESGVFEGDRDRILQVVSNLVSNALKFTPRKGTVTLSTHRTPEDIEISVEDTGPGLPANRLTQIFEKFEQGETRSQEGLGLGLYISKMLVELHGGALKAESNFGHGARFTFTVPISLAMAD